jgi:phospholipase C
MRKSHVFVALAAAAIAAVVGLSAELTPAGKERKPLSPPVGIHKIKHVIVIMQENRSFDQYFGTYPGADGFPRTASGEFAVCVPDPVKGDCERPYHDVRDLNAGGPHGEANAIADVNGGKMNGFIGEAELARHKGCRKNPNDPICSQRSANPDVMGYHDGSDIPNYWAYARNFVLQDHMSSRTLPGACPRTSSWSRSGRPGAPAPAIR